jgi:hypothetical protein
MHLRRQTRRWLSAGLVLVTLFTQLATAAYACPAVRAAVAGDTATAMAGMPCAQRMAQGLPMDADQPGLCAQHCQYGNTQAPADHAPLAPPAQVALLPMFTLAPAAEPAAVRSAWAAREHSRSHAPPLAHSIAHCCFRI